MPDLSQLPHLLKLLDDESPEIRSTVQQALRAFGDALPAALREQRIELTPEQRALLEQVTNEQERDELKTAWRSLLEIRDEKERLECALSLLAIHQYGSDDPESVTSRLDTLAAEYMLIYDTPGLHTLADFLFREKGLRGSEQDYYNPLKSNIVRVIESKSGLPISLVSIYMLVGKRVGLKIEGCNYPGHFLAIAYERDERVLVDCYSGGRFVTEKDIASSNPSNALSIDDILDLECDSLTMIARILRNLINAYETSGDPGNGKLMMQLLELTEAGRAPKDEEGEEE